MSGKPSWGVDNGPVLAAAAVPSTSSRGRALLVVTQPSPTASATNQAAVFGGRQPIRENHRGH
jgi:hypothetical protein